MAMAPGNQAITGGTVLRIPAMQSPNYVPGVSGWIVRQDGSAEFTTGTFRGSIEVGPLTGQHFIVNNSATGDPLDIYNSSNQLIFSINAFGVAESHNPSNGLSAGLQTGQLEINDGTGNNDFTTILLPAATTAQQSRTELNMSPPVGTTYTLNLYGGSDDGTKKPTLVGNERNIQGSMVQSDQRSTANLIHVGSYHSTVVDAFGDVVIAHGAAFTPQFGILTAWDNTAAGQGWILEWFQNPFTSTNMSFFVRQQGGGIPPVGTNVGVHAVLFG